LEFLIQTWHVGVASAIGPVARNPLLGALWLVLCLCTIVNLYSNSQEGERPS
jgi:hypothetical protein